MAELIPLEYRIQVARHRLISHWLTAGIVTAAIAATALFSTYMWKRRQTTEFARLERQYRESAVHIQQFNSLKAKRDNLADRMKKIGDLRSDQFLLSLLHNTSAAFSDSDCLQYICVDAYPGETKKNDPKYSVRVRGITVDDQSHSQLLDRLTDLGKNSKPPLRVPLGEKHLQVVLNGNVICFDILADQPLAKGN
jgi:hypothetical protein